MGRSPSSLRRGAPGPRPAILAGGPRDTRFVRRSSSAEPIDSASGVTLRLDYRAPYDWERLLGFLRARAIPGVELVGDDGTYRRVVHLAGVVGELALRPDPRVAPRCG